MVYDDRGIEAPDHSTLEGARKLALRLREFWRVRGYNMQCMIEEAPCPAKFRRMFVTSREVVYSPVYTVTTNMLPTGFPPRLDQEQWTKEAA